MLPGNTTSDFNICLVSLWILLAIFSGGSSGGVRGARAHLIFRQKLGPKAEKIFWRPPPSLFRGLDDRPGSPTPFSWRSGSVTDFSRNWLLRGTEIHSLVWFIFRWRIFMPICPLWNDHFFFEWTLPCNSHQFVNDLQKGLFLWCSRFLQYQYDSSDTSLTNNNPEEPTLATLFSTRHSFSSMLWPRYNEPPGFKICKSSLTRLHCISSFSRSLSPP